MAEHYGCAYTRRVYAIHKERHLSRNAVKLPCVCVCVCVYE